MNKEIEKKITELAHYIFIQNDFEGDVDDYKSKIKEEISKLSH